ncbi:MAG: hypothetical protein FWE36_04675 [Erysipelotrichales bacterium]|nr:hypothetical protein [Erysipelotrichales bacterium]
MKKIIFRVILFALLITIALFSIRSHQKNREVERLVAAFREGREFNEVISNERFRYYHVPRETFTDAFADSELLFPGMNGDLLVSLETPFPQIPIVNQLFPFFFGGHAAVSFGPEIIDITGNFLRTDINYVRRSENDFITNYRLKTFIGLRIINATENDFEITNNFYKESIGMRYNYFFLFGRNSRTYCTDLIRKAWNQPGLSRNFQLYSHRLFVSVQDLILSPDTEIFMYKYVDRNLVTHIYF